MNSKDGHSFLVIVSYDLNNIENAYCFFGNLFLLRTFLDSVKVMIKLPFSQFIVAFHQDLLQMIHDLFSQDV